MLENKQKITINNILISLLFISLIACIFFADANQVYAYSTNESLDEIKLDIEVEDKLENSQNSENEIKDTKSTRTFSEIQKMVDNTKQGGTINLDGEYVSNGEVIKINKKLNITSSSNAVLNAKNLSSIFYFDKDSGGSYLSNLKFINGKGEFGGAVYIGSSGLTVKNCEFEHNYAERRGGGVFVRGTHATFDMCIFNENRADTVGGALATMANALDADYLTVKNTKFTKNSACISSGGLAAFSNHSNVINCIFDSNSVFNNIGDDINTYGGAIQMGLDTFTSYGKVINSTFINNKAEVKGPNSQSHGGAGCVRNGSSYFNCIFINNTADHGGALTFHANGTMENCTFIDNNAKLYGGALSIELLHNNMNLNVSECLFEGNYAPYGGAIKLSGMNIKIENSTFNNNHAVDGGAVNIEAENVTILKSSFNRNIVENHGGAVYIMSKNTFINESEFIKNEAIPDLNKLNDGLGGAIYINSTHALIAKNEFKLNTARNGSAIYYDRHGKELIMKNNTLFENQAWVYLLPIFAKDIYYGEMEEIKSIIYGGNNIADYDNLAVSNAVYNAAENKHIEINGETPLFGATNTGKLYQDDREYNINILVTVTHEDGSIYYNETLYSNYLGEVFANISNLKPGKYQVSAKHIEDTYYKEITNITSFRVIPKVDVEVKKSADLLKLNYGDIVVWSLNIKNNGPNNATGVYLIDILPHGINLIRNIQNYNSSTGRLDIGNLNAGESLTINFTTFANKTGFITNNVNITSNELDIDINNNYDDETIDVAPAADLEIIKQVNQSNPNYLGIVTWTLTVINNGPGTATEVTVRDALPEGLILINSSEEFQDGIWDIGVLDVGEKAILIITTFINKTGLIENNASVKGYEFDYDLFNNNDSEIIKVNPSADLAILKSVNATNVNYGDIIKWKLDITNYGPNNATGVKIKDLLPESMILINHTGGDLIDGYFVIGNLAVGEKLAIDLICKVNQSGEFTNIANISGNEYDFNLTNNHDNESVFVNPAADLGVIKTADEFEKNFGDYVIWTINVYNNGPDTAHEVIVKDLFDKSLIWISDDSNGLYDSLSGIWDVGQLAVGEIKTLNIKSKVNSTGLIENHVSVSGKEFDYNLTNNQDVEDIYVNESADLSILKSVNSTEANFGDLIKWTLIASNNGPSNATAVKVEDKLPKELILINYTATKGFYDDGIWVVCCLDSGESQTLEIICKINKTGSILNVATIKGDEYDPDPENNIDNESIIVPNSVDIAVIKNANVTQCLFDDYILWTITVTNNGPDNATGVKIFDELPAEVEFVNYNATKGSYENNIWNVGQLANGEKHTLNIICIVKDLNEIFNFVNATSDEYDWNMSNNYDEYFINVLPVSDLAISKSINVSNANYGDTVKWILEVTNNGPNDATNVFVRDVLPKGLRFIGSNGDYDDGIWQIGDLNNGETKILEIICKIDATGNFRNIAQVYGYEYDSDLSNNIDEESISVSPASDLAIVKKTSKNKYIIGDLIEYTIEVTNNGPDSAKNIKVNEMLDANLKIASFKASLGTFDSKNRLWFIKSLEKGQKAILIIKVIATKAGIVENHVGVSSDNYDPDLTNNNASVVVKIINNTKKSKISLKHDKHLNNNNPRDLNPINLQKHPTANSIAILVISILFSNVIYPFNMFKRR